MATVKPINAVWKLVPAGKGMSMIQSGPLPTEDAQLRLDDLEKEEGHEEPEDKEGPEMDIEREMPMGKRAMPAFGKNPMAAPGGRGQIPGAPMGRAGMPPFAG